MSIKRICDYCKSDITLHKLYFSLNLKIDNKEKIVTACSLCYNKFMYYLRELEKNDYFIVLDVLELLKNKDEVVVNTEINER